MLNGQVQGEVGVGLEHIIEKRSSEFSKVTCVQAILKTEEERWKGLMA